LNESTWIVTTNAAPAVVTDNANKGRPMGKIIISENVSLDGVVQDPAGDEGFRVGGWVGRVGDRGREEAVKVLLDEALRARALLFGRRSCKPSPRGGHPAVANWRTG
jgi:hypothetical protein